MTRIDDPAYPTFRSDYISHLKPRSCEDCPIRGGFEYRYDTFMFLNDVCAPQGYSKLMEQLRYSGFCQDVGRKATELVYQLARIMDHPGVARGPLCIRCCTDDDEQRPDVTAWVAFPPSVAGQRNDIYTPEELKACIDRLQANR